MLVVFNDFLVFHILDMTNFSLSNYLSKFGLGVFSFHSSVRVRGLVVGRHSMLLKHTFQNWKIPHVKKVKK